MQTIDWIKSHKKIMAYTVGIAVLICAAFLLYRHFLPEPQPVTQESEVQAQTPKGVEQAADAAQVPISQEQAADAAQQIKYIYDHGTQPQYIAYTTVQQAPAAEEAARQKAGADFAIITDKKDPAKAADLSNLPANTPVELNQYNIQAYKSTLHTIEYAPKSIDDYSPGMIGYSVSKKITKDGKYLGVGAEHNFDNHKTYVTVSYTW
jgi:hypothetical protein